MEANARSEWWPRRFYALHLWTVFALFISNVFLGLTVVFVLFGWLRDRKSWRRRAWANATHVKVPFLLYVLLLLLSVATSHDPRLSLDELGEIFVLTTLPLAFVLVHSRRDVRLLIDGICGMAAGCALWGLGQLLTEYGDLSNRIRGPFAHYMTLAGVLLIADVLLVSRLVSLPPSWKDWRWPALVVINLALVGSLTRSAWVALILTLFFLALMRAPRSLVVLVPLAVLLIALAPRPVQERILSIGDLRNVTSYDRLCMAEAGLHMISERPLFGLGPQVVRDRYPIYRQPTAPRLSVKHLHNTFLQLAAERGLLSLAAYLWLMTASMARAYREYRRARRSGQGTSGTAYLYLGSFLALLAFNLAGLFEANWLDTEIQRLALFLVAVPYVLSHIEAAGRVGTESA